LGRAELGSNYSVSWRTVPNLLHGSLFLRHEFLDGLLGDVDGFRFLRVGERGQCRS
jgi:hypothetical protein